MVRCGKQTTFWKDVWLEKCPLSVSFPRLFRICHDKAISVHTAGSCSWNSSYRRGFGEPEVREWNALMAKLSEVTLTEEEDGVIWNLEPSGKFTTKSIYRFITFGRVFDVRMLDIWRAKIPLKDQIFLWLAWRDRIQTTQQLKRRNWDGTDDCKFCLEEESVNHLLFQCPIARIIWCWIRDSLGWSRCPTSISSFQDLID